MGDPSTPRARVRGEERDLPLNDRLLEWAKAHQDTHHLSQSTRSIGKEATHCYMLGQLMHSLSTPVPPLGVGTRTNINLQHQPIAAAGGHKGEARSAADGAEMMHYYQLGRSMQQMWAHPTHLHSDLRATHLYHHHHHQDSFPHHRHSSMRHQDSTSLSKGAHKSKRNLLPTPDKVVLPDPYHDSGMECLVVPLQVECLVLPLGHPLVSQPLRVPPSLPPSTFTMPASTTTMHLAHDDKAQVHSSPFLVGAFMAFLVAPWAYQRESPCLASASTTSLLPRFSSALAGGEELCLSLVPPCRPPRYTCYTRYTPLHCA